MCDDLDVSGAAGLHRVLDALLELDLDTIDDTALHDLVMSTGRGAARLAAVSAKALAVWDRRRVWNDNGALRPIVRLGNELGIAPETAFIELRRARKLTGMPATFDALAAGEISVDHVELLCRANAGDARADFPDAEKQLVEACVTGRYKAAARTIKYWRQCTDPDGQDRDATKLVERRRLACGRLPDGSVYANVRLDPVGGTVFLDELHHLEHQLFEAEIAEHGEPVRTVVQRRADALIEMATRSTSTPPGSQRPRPLFTVLVGFETFAGRICELEDGTVIAPGQLLPQLCEADIERIVLDAPDRVLAVSQRRRFTGALRRAIQVRDRHCQHPSGCDTPSPDCDTDHITPWTHTKDTSQTNGRLLCTGHNRHPEPDHPRQSEATSDAPNQKPKGGESESGRPPPDDG